MRRRTECCDFFLLALMNEKMKLRQRFILPFLFDSHLDQIVQLQVYNSKLFPHLYLISHTKIHLLNLVDVKVIFCCSIKNTFSFATFFFCLFHLFVSSIHYPIIK